MSSPESQSPEELIELAFFGEGNEKTQILRDLIRVIDNDTHAQVKAADPEGISQLILVDVYNGEESETAFRLREADIDEDGRTRTYLSVIRFSNGDLSTDTFIYDWYADDQDNAVTFMNETFSEPVTGVEAADAMHARLHEMSSYVAVSSMDPNVILALNPIY